MKHLLLSLHVLFAIFAIGPLVGAATTAARGVRAGDAPAVTAAARTIRVYGYASLLVALLGMALVQPKWDAKFSYPWVWLSLVLYLLALGVTLGVLVPRLNKVSAELAGGSGAPASAAGPVAAAGGIIALIFAVIVFLMIYQPH